MQKNGSAGQSGAIIVDPREFLTNRKLLVADSDPIHQAFLLKLSAELGFDTRNVFLARDGAEAVRIVREEGVTTAIYDDSMGVGFLETILQNVANVPAESAFIFLVSQNSSQAGVGRAVEMDVDGYCLKPFSSKEFKTEFNQAFMEKTSPNEFKKILNLGKARLYEGDLDQAAKLFDKAKDLGTVTSSAHFYAGQVRIMKQLLDESRQEFMQGILLNQIHCKCLKAMFEMLQSQRKTEESYEVLRRLVGVFPDNLERLKLAITLSVQTRNFFDILTWFEVYEGQAEKPDDLRIHVCAALSIFGRYLLMADKFDEAVQAFDRALSVGFRKEIFLTYAVESLQKYKLGHEATRLVKIHDPEFAEALAGVIKDPNAA